MSQKRNIYIELEPEVQEKVRKKALKELKNIMDKALAFHKSSDRIQFLKQELFKSITGRASDEWFKTEEIKSLTKEVEKLNEVIQRKAAK